MPSVRAGFASTQIRFDRRKMGARNVTFRISPRPALEISQVMAAVENNPGRIISVLSERRRADEYRLIRQHGTVRQSLIRHRVENGHTAPEMRIIRDEFLMDRVHLIRVLSINIVEEQQFGGTVARLDHRSFLGARWNADVQAANRFNLSERRDAG